MEDQYERERKARRDAFYERFWSDNPYALSLLKGHLIVEEVLEEIILSGCKNAAAMRELRLAFHIKAKLAQAISGVDSPVWTCVEKLNSARNELAHKEDISALELKVDAFITVCRNSYPQLSWENDRIKDLDWSAMATYAALSRIVVNALQA